MSHDFQRRGSRRLMGRCFAVMLSYAEATPLSRGAAFPVDRFLIAARERSRVGVAVLVRYVRRDHDIEHVHEQACG